MKKRERHVSKVEEVHAEEERCSFATGSRPGGELVLG